MDGNNNLAVGNLDAYDLLFRIACHSCHFILRKLAIHCIQDLISLNPINAVAAWKFGGIDRLIQFLRRACETNMKDEFITPNDVGNFDFFVPHFILL